MKKILSLILAMLMIVGVLASCGESSNDDGDNAQNDVNGNGEGVEDAKPNNGNDQNTSTKSLESYVLNNPEYLEAIASSRSGSNISKTPVFDPHPYAYLRAKGHDVEAIKNGTIECESISYKIEEAPNTLYIATKVYENGVATHYHLCYELPEEAMNVVNVANRGPYLQAAFVNDAVSKFYDPKTETCIKIPKSASKNLDDDFDHIIDEGSGVFSFVTKVNPDNSTLTYRVIPKIRLKDRWMASSVDMVIYDIKSKYFIETYKDVYDIPHSTNHMLSEQITTQHCVIYNAQDLNWHYSIPGFEDNFNK